MDKRDPLEVSKEILDIIYEYRLQKLANTSDNWSAGTPTFLRTISRFVEMGSAVRMCLPAFPYKSANKTYKVLGSLPDTAEKVSLERLNDICLRIGKVYGPGAKLLIFFNGFVYNDLLTIPELDVWYYVEYLRNVTAKQYEHIEFSRLEDLVNIQLPAELDEVTFVANATNFRRALMNQFGKDDMDVKEEIANDENMRLSWCGHKRYLENDLRFIFP
ncbi:hypothetical protein MMC25_006097, partial [Agyrium rufum]|nr:hypothetical protein [Agyrium rufum]